MTNGGAPAKTEAPVAQLGGGRSARLAAVAVAIVLVAVVWVGTSGRVATPTQPPQNPIVAVASDVSETATGLPGPEQSAGASQSSGPAAPPPALSTLRPFRPPPETYGVNALIGSRQYIGILDLLEPDYLSTTVRVQLPTDSRRGTLAISQLFVGPFPDPAHVVGSWEIPLRALSAVDRDRKLVLDATVPADPSLVDAPPIVRRGYDVKVYAENDLLFGLLTVEVTMRPPPIERPPVADYLRGRGLYNECRWDLSPISAQPNEGTDEADC